MQFTLTKAKRWLLFLLATFFFYIITATVIYLLSLKFGQNAAGLRILAVVQDIFLFIAPALVTAMLITRLPATFLAVDRTPNLKICGWGILAMLFSIPAMNAIIAWNESLALPDALAPLEQILRASEDAARATMEKMMGAHSVPSLIVNVLIIGIMAAFSEEIFFRGTLQRLFATSGVNVHVAIWATAIIFSAFHMQFFGFVPRMLLGALFGYALMWSGSLWLPVVLHALNNSLYLITEYIMGAEAADNAEIAPWPFIVVSVALTIVALFCMHRSRRKDA